MILTTTASTRLSRDIASTSGKRSTEWRTSLLCLGLLALGGALAAQTPAAEPACDASTASLNVVVDAAIGTVRLNGVPVLRLGERGGQYTSMMPLAKFGVNGANELSVEAKPAKAGAASSVEVLVFAGEGLASLDRPVFREKLTGAGTIRHTLVLRNAPRHLFDDATPWRGEDAAVLAAVQRLHDALAKHDMITIAAFVRPEYESQPENKNLGPFDDLMRGFEGRLKESTVLPLPANLKVERFLDGRLIHVAAADGGEPIRIASGKTPDGRQDVSMDLGAFWCYRQGAWAMLSM